MSVNMRIALSAITTASGILLAACGGDASRYYDDCRICIAVKEGDWEKAEFMLDVGGKSESNQQKRLDAFNVGISRRFGENG